jgi:RNA polymerase sigma factor (sigma-70 family)
MIHEIDYELYAQCLRCIKRGISTNQYSLTESRVDDFARWVARQVSANQAKGRVHQDRVSDPITGIPSSYIDVVISCALEFGPHLDQLKDGDVDGWNEIMTLIRRRVGTNLQPYAALYGPRFHGLAEELVQQCVAVLWINLDCFTYDTNLESWVSQFVAFEVSTERRRADFRRNSTAHSLDQPVGFEDGIGTLGELLPDGKAAMYSEKMDLYLTVWAASEHLSADQHEVIWRTLSGQTLQDIADHMGKKRNTIDQLRHRAVKILRKHID